MAGALEGIRVLDWTIWQMGPVASRVLADLGAEVIKIEHPITGDMARGVQRISGVLPILPGGINYYFESNNRNKKGITLDLKKPKGKQVLSKLVENSDVFVTNFRKDVAERLGVDYQTLRGFNPRLIYAVGSGYGQKGPDSGLPAADFCGVARSGMMYAVGETGMTPLYVSGGIADQTGGFMLALGVMAALIARERLGRGQLIEVSLLGSMVAMQGLNLDAFLTIGQDWGRFERAKAANPLWNYYRCADDRWIAFAATYTTFWPIFCEKVINRPELSEDPKFKTMEGRRENAQELISILDKIFLTKPREEWMELAKEADIWYAPLNKISDLPNDPQVSENYIFEFDHPTAGHLRLEGFPVQLGETPASYSLPAPELGQHTEEILLEVCKYSWEEIESLRKEGII